MIQIIIFTVLLLISALGLLTILFHCILFTINRIRKSKTNKILLRLKKTAIITGGAIVIMFGFTAFSHFSAKTPPILDSEGRALQGSIAELKKVNLNGRDEWISIRGKDKNKPILLFLAGGPGGSQMAAERNNLAALEDDFVVVNWDQPGSCKSFGVIDTKDITINIYIQDGYALTDYLCKTFGKDKIYIVGESWGSALGIFLAKEHPEKYYSFIGTGQMVDFTKTDEMDYEKAMEIAQNKNDTKLINKLKANGKPPYYGDDIAWKFLTYNNCLNEYMSENSDIQNFNYDTMKTICSPEYDIVDKINYFMALFKTFNHFYPQLYNIDLRKEYAKIDVPVYFFIGRHDVNAPTSLTEDYYKCLEAPEKNLIWFEHSGHDPWINENDKFIQELLKVTVQKN